MNWRKGESMESGEHIGFFNAALLIAGDIKRIVKGMLTNVLWLAVGVIVGFGMLLLTHNAVTAIGLVVFVLFFVFLSKLIESKRRAVLWRR